MTTAWKRPPVGVISMSYARPFTAAHFPYFARMRRAGMEFVELLVKPGQPPQRLDGVEE